MKEELRKIVIREIGEALREVVIDKLPEGQRRLPEFDEEFEKTAKVMYRVRRWVNARGGSEKGDC